MLIWYKMSADIFRDRKVRTMTLEETGFWALCLGLAKVGDGLIPSAPEIAWEFREDIATVERLVASLVEKKFLESLSGGGFTPNDWEQYQETKSSDRVKKHREAKKGLKPAIETSETFHAFQPVSHETSETFDETERNILKQNETPREEKSKRRVREEFARGPSLVQPADGGPRPKPNPDLMAGFEEFIAEYPNQIQVDRAAQTWLSLADLGEIDESMHAGIMAGLDRWKISRQWEADNGRFVPAPYKFLLDRLWRDNPPKGDSAKSQERFPEWEPPKKNREKDVA